MTRSPSPSPLRRSTPPLLLVLAALPAAAACRAVELAPPSPEQVAMLRPRDPASPEACRARRAAVARSLGDGLLVAVSGPDEDEGRYQADDDFHWLTGVSVPDSALVLVAANGEVAREALFLPPYDERFETWNGPRLAPGREAQMLTGIEETRSNEGLEEEVGRLAPAAERVRVTGPDAREILPAELRELPEPDRFQDVSAARVASGRRFLAALQSRKDPHELEALHAAVRITEAAIQDAVRVAVPGAWEFTAEAAIESGFRKRGAQALAFATICGSGPNTCYLHYCSNERRLGADELLLMDVGAKVHGYCADVTRTIPVSGRFTARQREIYDLVHEASLRASETLRPGSTISEAHEAARAVFEREGLADRFLHSVGHGLGLRVHDAPSPRTPLEPGMVVTIEPGLYLPDEAIGVRIEDDWLITEDGARQLSDGIPSDSASIEALVARLRSGR